MTSKPTFRPEIEAISLEEALADVPVLTGLEAAADLPVTGVTVDSSDVAEGWIFVAIGGAKRHGIEFAQAAASGGAVAVVTDRAGADRAGTLPVPVVVVDDPRTATALIANRVYAPTFRDVKLVGVTGTNGKTTTTYLIRSALGGSFGEIGLMGTVEVDVDGNPVIASRTTAESPVVYQSVATAAQHGRSVVVIETSSHALSLSRVDGLIFDSVAFTNLQHDHLDFYGSMEDYFEAKALLFASGRARQGVVCVDDKWGRRLAAEAQIPIATVSALSDAPADLAQRPNHWQVTSAADDPDRWGVRFTLRGPDGAAHDCFCPIPGVVNVQNAAAAIVVATQLGVPVDAAVAGVAEAPSIPGRMELIPTDEATRPRVLVDYAHTPEALEALLKTVRPFVSNRLILVFGTDGDRDATKRVPLAECAAAQADILWVTDENPRTEDPQEVRDYLLEGIRNVRPDMSGVTEVTTSRRDAVREAILSAKAGDLVLITGKGAESAQEVMGVFHEYMDSTTAKEVVASFI